jgi:hypothetical protein
MSGLGNDETGSVYQHGHCNFFYIPVAMNSENTLYPYAVMGFRRKNVLITGT